MAAGTVSVKTEQQKLSDRMMGDTKQTEQLATQAESSVIPSYLPQPTLPLEGQHMSQRVVCVDGNVCMCG